MSLQTRTISLATALWGFPAAPGCASQDAHAPDSWQRAFATQPEAGPAILGLFRSSKAGRDWALVTAPSATLRIDCRTRRKREALVAQLAAAKQCLAVRGGRRTSVELQCDDGNMTHAVLQALLHSFRGTGAGTGVCELTILATDEMYGDSVEWFIYNAVPVLFPNLTTLTLRGCAYPLPPPAKLPRLSTQTMLTFVH